MDASKVKEFSKIFKIKKLEKVVLKEMKIKGFDVVLTAIKSNKKIKFLELISMKTEENTKEMEESLKLISLNNNLMFLDFSGNNLSNLEKKIDFLVPKNLESLKLMNINLSEFSLLNLLEKIKTSPKFKELDISQNNLSNFKSIDHIFKSLKNCSNITSLNLSNCNLKDDLSTKLFDFLPLSLRKLSLVGVNASNQSFINFSSIFNKTQLEFFDFSDNYFEIKSVKKFLFSLKNNKFLKHLDISVSSGKNSFLTETTQKEIMDCLIGSYSLENVMICNKQSYNITHPILQIISAKRKIVRTLFLIRNRKGTDFSFVPKRLLEYMISFF